MTGDEIRDARQRAHLTQDELGRMIGVTGRTIGNWERGASVPRNRMAALVEALSWQDDEPAEAGLSTASDVELLAEIARRFARTGKEATHDREDAPEPGPQEGSPQHRGQDSAEDGRTSRRGAPIVSIDQKQREADAATPDHIADQAADREE